MNKETIIISSCLLGINCTYKGSHNKISGLDKLMRKYHLLHICPEQSGGMATPRIPSEIKGKSDQLFLELGIIKDVLWPTGNNEDIKRLLDTKKPENRVFGKNGQDMTHYFLQGALEALKMARLFNISVALLKEKSPSCGSNFVYDGQYRGKVIPGRGLTAQLFFINDIALYSEENFHALLES